MSMGIGISGTGRIGRLLIRRMIGSHRKNMEIKAINTSYSADMIAHLLKYDTVHGKWDADISVAGSQIIIDGTAIETVNERDPVRLPWRELGVSLAVDCTGQFNDRVGAGKHLSAGADKVIVTSPGRDADLTVVMGVNEHRYDPDKHRYLSSASCTTNCVVPILKIVDDAWQIRKGWMTTVHAYTNDQNHLDNPHKDPRRARACTQSIIPTSTGMKQALHGVMPHLASVMEGISLRVPTQDVSVVDLTLQLARPVTRDEAERLLKSSAEGAFADYVEFCSLPLVSSDFIGNEKSAIIDGPSIAASGDQLKILAWYDNEWGYTCRVADLVAYMIGKTGEGAEDVCETAVMQR